MFRKTAYGAMFKQLYFYEMMKFKALSLKHQEGYSLYFFLEGESMPSLSLGLKKKLFVSCNGPKKNRVGRLV